MTTGSMIHESFSTTSSAQFVSSVTTLHEISPDRSQYVFVVVGSNLIQKYKNSSQGCEIAQIKKEKYQKFLNFHLRDRKSIGCPFCNHVITHDTNCTNVGSNRKDLSEIGREIHCFGKCGYNPLLTRFN